jgi:hypothetical protein
LNIERPRGGNAATLGFFQNFLYALDDFRRLRDSNLDLLLQILPG